MESDAHLLDACEIVRVDDNIPVFRLKSADGKKRKRRKRGKDLNKVKKVKAKKELPQEPLYCEALDQDFVTAKKAAIFDGFQCQTCSKFFPTRRNLIRHTASVHESRYKTYSRIKKHPCTFENCDKSFTCQTLLDDHLNMHNGIYAYECDTCSQKFFARARFAVHLIKYHNQSIKEHSKNPLIEDLKGALADESNV